MTDESNSLSWNQSLNQQPSLRQELEGLHLDHPHADGQASDGLRRWLETDEGQQANESVRELDRQMWERLQSVDIPGGLQERLLASLRDEQSLPLDECDEETTDPADNTERSVGLAPKTTLDSRGSRSRWPISIALSVAGLMIAGVVMAVVLWPKTVTLSRESIAYRSLQWASGLSDQTWYDINREILIDARLPDDLAASPVRWSRLATEWDEQTVLYDLSGPENRLAMLFVVSLEEGGSLPDRFPAEPDYFTGNLSVASSYQEGRLYILMVEGDVQRYRSFLVPVWPFG